MESTLEKQWQTVENVQPLCPVFGECKGCSYQDIAYSDELAIKEKQLKGLLNEIVPIPDDIFASIVPSPKPYYYRNRLDLKLKRTKDKGVLIGFTPEDRRGIVPVEACYIAEENISAFIPELKKQAIERLPAKYCVANLVVRTGDDGRVKWGGIGRRSCELSKQDYFWTEAGGRRMFYSLDTFFQANLSIIPKLLEEIRSFPFWDSSPVFYDLYGGVGFFSVGLMDKVNEAVLIEESLSSLGIARHNFNFNKIDNYQILSGKVEDKLPSLFKAEAGGVHVAMIDPPRAGLSRKACQLLAETKDLDYCLYLSCNPGSLARDLSEFVKHEWTIQKVVPFDFFPKTTHLETLVVLCR